MRNIVVKLKVKLIRKLFKKGMLINKKKFSQGIYKGKPVFVAAVNELYALVTYTSDKSKLFKVDLVDLTELK